MSVVCGIEVVFCYTELIERNWVPRRHSHWKNLCVSDRDRKQSVSKQDTMSEYKEEERFTQYYT